MQVLISSYFVYGMCLSIMFKIKYTRTYDYCNFNLNVPNNIKNKF